MVRISDNASLVRILRCSAIQFFTSTLLVGGFLLLSSMPHLAQQPSAAPDPGASEEDLQKATQNPVASLISVPFQNNTDLNAGSFARDKNTLNVQPVIPMQLGNSWNLIPRIITPIVFAPDYSQAHLGTFGLGDIAPTFFFAPRKASKLIWGVGPSFLLPTATDDNLGTGKFCIGPAVVALVQPGHWTLGALTSNVWSVAGPSDRPDINSLSLQYFVNYNMKKGWFLTSSPIVSANWNAPSGNIWLVPFGGGFGRIFKVGAQAMNGSISAYYNVVRPQPISPTWQLRLQLALLFPRMPKAAK